VGIQLGWVDLLSLPALSPLTGNVTIKFPNTGLNTRDNTPPRCVKLPPEIDAALLRVENRSAAMRRWIIAGLQAEGLIDADIAQKYLNGP
jgi:hypothetical protein